MPDRYDVCIVGAGLVGLAVGRALALKYNGISILCLEKEDRVAAHQSGHNSGVVHSGLYYRPGSLKARLCVAGRDLVYEFSEHEGVAYRRTGKLVVAVREAEIPQLDELERRGRANGLVGIRRLRGSEIAEIEPEATGLSALHVPQAGVVDYESLAQRLAGIIQSRGGTVATGAAVVRIDHDSDGVVVESERERYLARVLVNCAGLHSDRVALIAGLEPEVRIVPFRGEYYRLSDAGARLVRGLIYPVPDPRFPFLGVHFTRRIDDVVEVGPNAVLALGREHYRDSPRSWPDLRETIQLSGFRRLARRHWRAGIRELIGSRSARLYARRAQRLVPGLMSDHLVPGGSGVRAQAVARDGTLVDDFVIQQAGAGVHILNAPSPGATASLAIGEYVADLLSPRLPR